MSEKATRDSFGEALKDLGAEFPKIVVLDADLSCSTKSAIFGKAFPDRFFQMGIAEANMIGTAAGLSRCAIPASGGWGGNSVHTHAHVSRQDGKSCPPNEFTSFDDPPILAPRHK